MAETSIMERALALAYDPTPEPVTALVSPPVVSQSAEAALRKCRAAWQRAFNAYMRESDGEDSDRFFAAKEAAPAYCSAMPLLDGPDGVRAFLACTAYGILIGAIPPDRAGQLLYAAQIALAAAARTPKP